MPKEQLWDFFWCNCKSVADFQKVLETERTRLSAEDNLAIAEATMRSDLIKLYKALGGGWEAGAIQEISKDTAS